METLCGGVFNSMKFSASTMGFYHNTSTSAPQDCVAITDQAAQALFAQIHDGAHRLGVDGNGYPIAVAWSPVDDVTPVQLRNKLREQASDLYKAAMLGGAHVILKSYAHQQTSDMLEALATFYIDNWNGGSPTYGLTHQKVKPLVKYVAGDLVVAQGSVTQQQVYDASVAMLTDVQDSRSYCLAILGIYRGVIAALNAIDLNSPTAKTQLLAVDMENLILGVAAYELGL